MLNLPISFAFCKALHWSWTRGRYYLFGAVLTVLILLHLAPQVWGADLPFNLEECIFAVLYLFTGYFLRVYDFDLHATRNLICGGVIFVALRLIVPTDTLAVDLYSNVYGDFFVTYTASVTGVLALIALFSHLPEHSLMARFLSLCAQNSLYILMLHVPIYVWMDILLRDYLDFQSPVNWAWAHALTIVLSLLIALVLKRIDPREFVFKARPKRKAVSAE